MVTGNPGMCLFSEPVQRLRHAVEEKGIRRLLAAVTVRCGNQLFRLRHG